MSDLIEAWRLFVLACKACSAGQISVKVQIHEGGKRMTISFRCTQCGNYEERSS